MIEEEDSIESQAEKIKILIDFKKSILGVLLRLEKKITNIG